MIPDLALPRRTALSLAEPSTTVILDDEGFRALYEATASRLRGYLRRVAGNTALADDLVQETYLRLLRARQGDAAPIDNAAFVFKVATNLLYDHWRRQQRERRLLGFWRSPAALPDASLEQDVGRLLLQLKPRERALLWLAYVEGWSHDEIAEILGLRSSGIRVLLFRARARLAGLLARAGVGSEALR